MLYFSYFGAFKKGPPFKPSRTSGSKSRIALQTTRFLKERIKNWSDPENPTATPILSSVFLGFGLLRAAGLSQLDALQSCGGPWGSLQDNRREVEHPEAATITSPLITEARRIHKYSSDTDPRPLQFRAGHPSCKARRTRPATESRIDRALHRN